VTVDSTILLTVLLIMATVKNLTLHSLDVVLLSPPELETDNATTTRTATTPKSVDLMVETVTSSTQISPCISPNTISVISQDRT